VGLNNKSIFFEKTLTDKLFCYHHSIACNGFRFMLKTKDIADRSDGAAAFNILKKPLPLRGTGGRERTG
jgi:hypothetical protein